LRGLIAYRGALFGNRVVASWELLSHKILRFLSPVFLGVSALFVFAAAAMGNSMALMLSIALLLGALAVVPALFWEPVRRFALPRALGFFVLSNAAVVAALIDLVTGRKAVQWTPTRRQSPTAPREP
jgi:ABC-type transport system involved in cytochrome bd biosynthesis fused ATPase/permease subunit